MLVEVLAFPGCPHAATALELARRVAAQTRPEPEVRLVAVATATDIETMRFLGSPSIRVDGRDIEPGANARRDYSFSCRLHATEIGLRSLPSQQWLQDALQATPHDE
jgi:hypothetical protein